MRPAQSRSSSDFASHNGSSIDDEARGFKMAEAKLATTSEIRHHRLGR
jgi:hypothetical protein